MTNPAAVKVGPGLLYIAPIGTAEPASPTATLPSAWIGIGYTNEGHTFSTETSYENVEVAEELDPIRVLPTSRTSMLEFQMAELSATNILAAWNGGTITGPGGTPYVTVEPPDLGAELRLMLLWRDDYHEEQLLARRVLQVGSIEIPRQKAPNKAVIPVQFRLEVPTDGGAVFKHWLPASLPYRDPHV